MNVFPSVEEEQLFTRIIKEINQIIVFKRTKLVGFMGTLKLINA